MREFTGTASIHVDASPSEVFALLTDVDRLPEWNAAIEQVVERPATLVPGAEWVVRMHPRHIPSWGSASVVSELDAAAGRFGYETRNTDGNPSRTFWTWQVDADEGGAKVAVSWRVVLLTLDRRLLAGPMRKPMLAREVPRSLEALSEALYAAGAGRERPRYGEISRAHPASGTAR